MQPHEIENWALTVIERVSLGQPVEDARVELKSKWPEPQKAARRLAAHANAARGAPILWLIGVDEASTIPGVDYAEISNWSNSVQSSFDELAPELFVIQVPYNGVTVAALLYETTRAPFVVKVAEGGAVQREVPWRDATGVKSATRGQLLRLLSPLQSQPTIEIVSTSLSLTPVGGTSNFRLLWELEAILFITQQTGQETVIPSHRCTFGATIPGRLRLGPFSGLEFQQEGDRSVSKRVVTIRGSGSVEAFLKFSTQAQDRKTIPDRTDEEAVIQLSLQPVHSEHGTVLETVNSVMKEIEGGKITWRHRATF